MTEQETSADFDDIRTVPPPTISGRTVLEFVVLLALLASAGNALLRQYSISDATMTPTLINGQTLVVSRLTYQLRAPRRGELVLLSAPDNPARQIMRRVIGLPGETVELRGEADGEQGVQVAINGRPLAEPYLNTQLQNNAVVTVTSRLQLSNGEYFVLADNRAARDDSRTWGPITAAQLSGRAWLNLYPVERLGPVNHDIAAPVQRDP
jgi:signal peptidase I